MDVAIVAPCPIPYVIGGAENLWRGLQDHLNEHTPHQAEIIKLPSRERSFWELVGTYREFARLDLAGFDLVVSTKYPAWMVGHDRHVVYLQHRLRGLYDTYHFLNLPPEYPDAPPAVLELRAFMAEQAGRRDALEEFFARLESLRAAAGIPGDLFAFPGPFVREVVHWLDGVGLAQSAIHRYGAISQTVREREDYFPPGAEVFVRHHPTALKGLRMRRRGDYLFTASRLDNPKRVALIVEAMRHVKRDVELRIAGTGPEEPRLRELAENDPRIRFLGRLSETVLADAYRGARAVAFVPYLEDYGLITLEAFLCGKPVVTVADAGGVTELVQDGVTGRVAEPEPASLGAAIDAMWSDPRVTRAMGRAALEHGRRITWDDLVSELTR